MHSNTIFIHYIIVFCIVKQCYPGHVVRDGIDRRLGVAVDGDDDGALLHAGSATEAPAQNAAASFRRPLVFNRRHPIPDTRTHRPLASYAFSRRRLSKSL